MHPNQYKSHILMESILGIFSKHHTDVRSYAPAGKQNNYQANSVINITSHMAQ